MYTVIVDEKSRLRYKKGGVTINNKIIVGVIVVVIIVIGVVALMNKNSSSSMQMSQPSSTSQSSSSKSTAGKNAVTIQNYAFSPATITVKAGDKITWTNQDSVGHSATADQGSFDTGVLQQGQS